MNLYINKNNNIEISKIIYKDKYIIKEYFIRDNSFIKEIANNEININKKLLKNKFKYNPKLILIERSSNKIRLYFKKIIYIEFQSQFNKRLSNFRKLLYIIKKLHSIKICHFDLNLSNILIENNKIYLIDYALSCELTKENKIYDIKSLEKIARYLFNDKKICFKGENIECVIKEWSYKYEPIFKKRIIT